MKKKIGVVLAGCGVYDGSEIHETVIILLAIDRAGAEAVCMAPNIDQMHVINHLAGEEMPGEKRNVLVESARIARGNVKDISEVNADELDGLIIPGGFGVAKNLCDFAVKGENCEVNGQVADMVKDFVNKQKAMAACCIAPVMVAKVFEGTDKHPTLTIGVDKDVGGKINAMGSKHQECATEDIVIDKELKIVSTPAYMSGQSISEVATGIEKAVNQLVSML